MLCGKFRFNPYILSGFAFLAVLAWAGSSGAAPPSRPHSELELRFEGTVRPFVQVYCVSCHGKQKPAAQLDLTSYINAETAGRDLARWELLAAKLAAKQMPPPSVSKQPSSADRETVIAWVRSVRQYEALRDAGDPGPVLGHRLSNAEYDYTIRDLTGEDLRPTHDFPVDPANQEGFDNSGESLTISAALMKKSMQAAKDISDHLVLTSTGLEFASHPVMVETDRDKFCILRIVDFYNHQPTDYADYFEAAWRFRYRVALGNREATLASTAASAKVSVRYLDLVCKTLTSAGVTVGPIVKLQAMWNALPTPDKKSPDKVRAGCIAMRDWVQGLRKRLAWKFANLNVPRGFSDGGQVFVLWKDREYASHRRMLYTDNLQADGVPRTRNIPAREIDGRRIPARTVTDRVDPDLFVPKDESSRTPYMASLDHFCSVFPDAFYISERGRMFVDDAGDKGRLLTAGLHNSMGYFRDDTPLMELVLSEKDRSKLDHLWLDFDQVAFIPERMHREFFHYERAEAGTMTSAEFNDFRAEDEDITGSDAKIKRLSELYTAKAQKSLDQYGGDPKVIQAIEDHFKWVSSNIRATEKGRLAAEPLHRAALLEFASRAYRRPLTEPERADLLAFYRSLRKNEGLTHEDAIRDSVAAILMSPKFLFRLDLDSAVGTSTQFNRPRVASAVQQSGAVPETGAAQPLSDYALASRLSYFLWSSMPDQELLSHAAAGDLHRPEVLAAQTKRMLHDQRVRALAVEFGGNWLDFRRFEEHNAVDRGRFPSFNDDLRTAMFEEPIRFLMDEFQNDRSVLDLLYAKHTFVNAVLARHYGMTDVNPQGGQWVRVENADKYGRGGLLPMAVFLTKNAPGLRTSPVKRGYWVVRRVLGEYIPPPPPTVPALPSDESKMGDLTLRHALEEHRANPACAACHARFDSYGLVFEGYGPIGELRTKDLGGKLVDARAPFPGGVEGTGVQGLRDYIKQAREKDFLDTFGRKLLSYALERSLQPSDDLTLAEMRRRMAADGYRFEAMVETIVTSRQFRYHRACCLPQGRFKEHVKHRSKAGRADVSAHFFARRGCSGSLALAGIPSRLGRCSGGGA